MCARFVTSGTVLTAPPVLQVVRLIDHAASEGYASFAPFYDAYTEHPAFAAWIRGLAALAREHGGTGPRVLDVGCGTGKSLEPLLEDDPALEAVGVDAVPEMLERARVRLGDRAALVAADMTRLPLLGSFDAALCVNDAINCLLTPGAVAGALCGIAANLRPGGVLVFDTNTPLLYRDHFAIEQTRTPGDLRVEWRGTFDGDRAVAEVDVFGGEGAPLARSVHVQRLHPDAVIERALAAAGLEEVGRYGQHDDGSRSPVVEPGHFKVVHVVKRVDRAPSVVMRSRALDAG